MSVVDVSPLDDPERGTPMRLVRGGWPDEAPVDLGPAGVVERVEPPPKPPDPPDPFDVYDEPDPKPAPQRPPRRGRPSKAQIREEREMVKRAGLVARAMEARLEGKSFERVGQTVGVSRRLAAQLVREGVEEVGSRLDAAAVALRTVMGEELLILGEKLRPKAFEGDLGAARELRLVNESYRRLYGLDLKADAPVMVGEFTVVAPWGGPPAEPPAVLELDELR